MTLLLVKLDITPWIGVPIGMLVGVVAGVVIGFPTFRLRGHYFALAMLAYPLALLYVFEWLGYQEVALPMKREAPGRIHAVCGSPNLRRDRAGHAGRGVARLAARSSARASACRSRRSSRTRWAAEACRDRHAPLEDARRSWSPAPSPRAAGGFYAVVLLVVTPPTVFGMLTSAQALIVTLFGGVATVWGPVVGAVDPHPAEPRSCMPSSATRSRASRASCSASRSCW